MTEYTHADCVQRVTRETGAHGGPVRYRWDDARIGLMLCAAHLADYRRRYPRGADKRPPTARERRVSRVLGGYLNG